jgi:HD superfamily phosphohydrolase
MHTRFEHTLGVLFQARRLFSVLKERIGARKFDRNSETSVRLGALLHDVGHGPFSHTSEQYFSSLDQMVATREANPIFAESGAGEVLSSLIVTSQPFQEFVEALNRTFALEVEPTFLRALITGTVAPQNIYLSELIHGPFDADKLDYMHRDGMFSGLKMHIDVDRLYASISVKRAQNQTRLVGSIAGTAPLTQIMFNKMLLFTGIYHHQKVRAVDCMLWAIFDLAVMRKAKLGGCKIAGPADFLRLTDDQMLIPELTDDADIRELILRIRNRRLWKRALVVARRTVPEAMYDTNEESDKQPFTDFVLLAGNEQRKIRRRRDLASKIWQEAGKPCKEHEVWLDVPKLPSMDEAMRMWIQAPGQDQPETLGDFVPITKWVELYGSSKWQSHVFCPGDVCKKVSKAAVKVFKHEFGLEMLTLAQDYAGIER